MEATLQSGLTHLSASVELEPLDIEDSDINDECSPATEGHGLSLDSKKINKKRSKYQRIDDNLRQKLIDAVVKDGNMLKVAAKKFKINYSSAKSIFHTFRKEGRINKKTVRDRYGKTSSFVDSTKENTTKKAAGSPTIMKTVKTTTASSAPKEENSIFSIKPAKNLSVDTSLYDPKLGVFSQVNGLPLQSNPLLANTLAIQNQNLMQNLMQKAASIKLLQEFTQMQSMLNPCLPLIPNNFQLNSGPLNSLGVQNYSAMMALQAAQAAQLNQYTKERQKMVYTSIPGPMFQGYQGSENAFSVNTSG